MATMVDHRRVEISRVTAGGRKLTYCLRVIQQPERARACGSGAKSSADRRPVDPPPVVELRIFEGEGPEREDITFGYNANFFLFATLEVARPIANGRIHPPPQQQVPVLTGMPVSGMAYLDRPTEAGYFIFPDLSVRHEGKYKLSFNLYEEIKEAKDADAEPSTESKPKIPGGSGAPDSSFDWRLEVKSATFVVYSAKKFPGLAESTVLSRTVAEQGCRVRIRRDVRMRRRGDGKPGGDYDEAPEDAYARSRPEEQDPYRERSRSLSSGGASDDRAPYQDPQRRNSGEYSQPPYPSQYAHPQPGPHGHLSFGASTGSQFQAPPQPQFAQPQPPAPQTYQPPAPPSYQQQPPQSSQYRPPPPPPPPPPTSSNYGYDRQYPQSAYPTNPPRDSFEPEYRRASVPYPPQPREFPAVDSNFNRPPYHSYPPRAHSPAPRSPVNLAPLKMAPIEPKYDHSSPLASVNRIAPAFPSPAYDRAQDRSRQYSQYTPQPPAPEPARNGKRPFDTVFKSSSTTQPLYNGMRPGSSHNSSPYEDDEAEMTMDQLKMQYKRADGSSYSRELPTLE